MSASGTPCGTSVRNLENPRPENRHPLRKRNLAEPFPTHFTRNNKYMINFSKSDICRFRRFRPYPLFLHLDKMCGKRFRRFRSNCIPANLWPALRAVQRVATGVAPPAGFSCFASEQAHIRPRQVWHRPSRARVLVRRPFFSSPNPKIALRKPCHEPF